MSFLFVLIALGVVFWFIAVQPQRRRQRAHMAMQDAVAEGLEIITAGGLHGTVVEAGESVVRIEIAPGVIVRLDRRAVAAVVPPEEPEDEDFGEPVEEAR
jgi:preprotein translocase subunit YajC